MRLVTGFHGYIKTYFSVLKLFSKKLSSNTILEFWGCDPSIAWMLISCSHLGMVESSRWISLARAISCTWRKESPFKSYQNWLWPKHCPRGVVVIVKGCYCSNSPLTHLRNILSPKHTQLLMRVHIEGRKLQQLDFGQTICEWQKNRRNTFTLRDWIISFLLLNGCEGAILNCYVLIFMIFVSHVYGDHW